MKKKLTNLNVVKTALSGGAKLSLLAFSISVLASPDQYDLSLGGNPSWNENTPTTNFWEHRYVNPSRTEECKKNSKKYNPAKCLVCEPTDKDSECATHTGRDTHSTETKKVKINGKDENRGVIRSYGFGQVKAITNSKSLSYIGIQHLLNSGEVVKANLLHGDYENTLKNNDYLAKKQLLGTESNNGDGIPVHLHTEIASTTSSAWVYTSNAIPDKNGTREYTNNGKGALIESYDKDGLIAHYDKNKYSPIFYSPDDTFNNHLELLPWLSNNSSNTTPSSSNFDVYGIAGKPFYGKMELKRTTKEKSFNAISILVNRGSKRDSLTSITAAEGKWLAATWANSDKVAPSSSDSVTIPATSQVYPIQGNRSSYTAGDYAATPSIKENATTEIKGYPVIFSVLANEKSKVIDNDKPTGNAYVKTGRTETEPGYFLTSDIANGKSDASATWQPNAEGEYQISVFIPKTTNSKVVYRIKQKSGDAPSLACVTQNNANGSWSPLVVIPTPLKYTNQDGIIDINDLTCTAGGNTTTATKFNFTNTGLVSATLSFAPSTDITTKLANNEHLKDKKVAFDAVKFEVPSTTTTTPSSIALLGKTIGYKYHYPTINDIALSAPNGNYVVSNGVEIADVSGAGISLATMDISNSNILVQFTRVGSWDFKDFNGFEIYDVNNSIANITDVVINPATNLAGFDKSRITFNANQIWINWQGLSFDANTKLSLDIK